MKKILSVICVFILMNLNSQTKTELLNAGIKLRTVETIHKKFDGDISKAINKWADSGNGKLSKDFIEAAANLGLNRVYLESKLKLARQQRLKTGILGAVAIATGVAAANGLFDGGGGGGAYSNSTPTYYSKDYDYSKKKKRKKYQYNMNSITEIDNSYYNSVKVEEYSNNSSYSNENNTNSVNKYSTIETTDSSLYTSPIFYGSTSSYTDGINQLNTGYDESGTLNIYDNSGMTIGAVKKDANGIGVYRNGILETYTSNPDNNNVSVTYKDGIPISVSKKDKDGSISYYNDGIITGHSKKVKGGYENYDKDGMITSFTKIQD
jgi:hypothetical protein